jgi:CheY-like chemotaxis protein
VSSCHCIEETQPSENNDAGRILIADDQETFLYATAELLRDEGYHCDCARDATEALQRLRLASYDLLITDIKMPGNPNLELITAVQQLATALPVIVVTGYPSLDSAIDSVHLSVVAYLVKPLEFEQLLSTTARWVEQSKAYQTMCRVERGVKAWSQELRRIIQLLERPASPPLPQLIDAFVATTLKNMAEPLIAIQRLAGVLARPHPSPEQGWMCQLARTETVVDLLRETVDVLERTKNAFKSKQLGHLRHRLQVVLDQWESDYPPTDR